MRARLLPTVSISQAVFSTSSRSLLDLDARLGDPVLDSTRCRRAACRTSRARAARSHISSSARSAMPIARMQWWMRPGPSRACAIAKPVALAADQVRRPARARPSKRSSPWPSLVRRSRTPAAPRTISTPGVSSGTRTIDCCRWRGAVRVGLAHHDQDPAVAGACAPVVHHLRPLRTYSSPSRSMRSCDVGRVGGGDVGLGHREAPSGSRRRAAARSQRSFCSARAELRAAPPCCRCRAPSS